MTTDVVIFHNPRCSKSRQTLKLLRDRGIEPDVVRYLDNPPTRAAIGKLLKQLGIEAHALLRRKEARYRELELSADVPATQLIEAMAEHPILIERPIVIAGDQARIGRPPEAVLEILPS